MGKRGLLHATIYSIFKLQKFRTNKTTKTQVHSQDGLQYFSFLCPTRSSRAKPSPAGNRKPGLQLFSSISRVVHYIAQVVLFLLESSLSFPLLWFFLPTELFQSPHLLLKVLMLIPRWGKKEKKFTLFLGIPRCERFFEMYNIEKKTLKTFSDSEVHIETHCNVFNVTASSNSGLNNMKDFLQYFPN